MRKWVENPKEVWNINSVSHIRSSRHGQTATDEGSVTAINPWIQKHQNSELGILERLQWEYWICRSKMAGIQMAGTKPVTDGRTMVIAIEATLQRINFAKSQNCQPLEENAGLGAWEGGNYQMISELLHLLLGCVINLRHLPRLDIIVASRLAP